jgi:hypothetical protein
VYIKFIKSGVSVCGCTKSHSSEHLFLELFSAGPEVLNILYKLDARWLDIVQYHLRRVFFKGLCFGHDLAHLNLAS